VETELVVSHAAAVKAVGTNREVLEIQAALRVVCGDARRIRLCRRYSVRDRSQRGEEGFIKAKLGTYACAIPALSTTVASANVVIAMPYRVPHW